MSLFRKLSLASLTATVLLVTIGGLVRATKSGLGCGTDWPDCGGELVPTLHTRAVLIEYSHRLAALCVIVLLGSLAVVAWRKHGDDRRILWASLGAFGLVLAQAALGAIVVILELKAETVVLHLVTAMLLLGLLVYLVVAAGAREAREHHLDASVATRSLLAAGAVLVLLVVGSYMTGLGRDAALAFTDWPLMGGEIIPELGNRFRDIHFLHRALAAVVGAIVVATALPIARRRHDLPAQARLAALVIGLFAAEVLIGAANIWTELNAIVVTLHLFTGAAIWGSLVGIAALSHPLAHVPAAQRDQRRRSLAEAPR